MSTSLKPFDWTLPVERRSGLPMKDAIPARSQVICVASGKGGTGKTFIACNLAVALSARGLRTTLVDADFGLANAHILLGLEPRNDISRVLSGEQGINDIVTHGPLGVRLVPGGAGNSSLAMAADERVEEIVEAFSDLEEDADVILIDLAAGLSRRVARFLGSAHDIVLVCNHEQTSRSDILSTIAMLADTLGAATVHLVINMARDREHAVVTFQKLWSEVNHAWRGRIRLYFSGWLPKSPFVPNTIVRRKPIRLAYPNSTPARCIDLMGERLHKHHQLWRSRQVGRWSAPSAFAPLIGRNPAAEN